MRNSYAQRPIRFIAKTLIGSLGLIVGAACSTTGQASPMPAEDKGMRESIDEIANQMAAEYGQQQMLRLAKNRDRDSLIAAVLAGLPNDAKADAPEGLAELLQRLVNEYSTDPLALFTAALVCNTQSKICAHAEYQSQLTRISSTNAVHFLLVPRDGKLSTAQLHLAALAGEADTRFSELLGIVRSALADQPAPTFPAQGQAQTFDVNELALVLRRNEIASVPWPNYGPTMEICNAETAALRKDIQFHADCSKLGHALFADTSNNIVTRMVGGSMIRRFATNTSAAAEAKALRRQYVWLSGQLPEEATSAEKEKLNEEEVLLGEWEAYQRHAERAGVQRVPPADWAPSNPEVLLLPEERTSKP